MRKTMLIPPFILIMLIVGCVEPKITDMSNDDSPIKQSTSSNIYEELESGGDFLKITHNCFWSGTQIRCNGEVEDIETNPHTTDDIYADLIVYDNSEKCCYCSDKQNLGEFGPKKVKTYSLSCDVGKKTDILASIAITGGALRICSSCDKR
jgi:hypothetical protein